MPAAGPQSVIAVRFKRFREDLEHYNYARIWFALTFAAVLTGFAGTVIVGGLTKNTQQPSYRLSVLDQKSLSVPPLRFELVSGLGTAFSNYACSTKSGRVIPLTQCPSGESSYPCLQMTLGGIMATPSDNNLNCILGGTANDSSFMVRVSLPTNPNTQLFSTYIKSTDGAYVWLSQTQFTTATSTYNSYTITSEYYNAGAVDGVANMNIVFPSFSISNWIEWKPFSGWTAFGTIGGVIFFVWLLHSIVMYFLGLFFENPWDVDSQRTNGRPNEMIPLAAHQPFRSPSPASMDQ